MDPVRRRNLYIAARCWDSHPEREVANELRRDNGNILGNENVTFVIDTFHDRRNGYLFQTNPLGALRDMTVTDDQQNSAWNGIWTCRPAASSRAGRWRWRSRSRRCATAATAPQTWGINLRRLVKWKNEFSYLSLVPGGARHRRREPHGVGGDAWSGSRRRPESKNLELKPYAVSSPTTNRTGGGPSTTTSTPTPGSTSSTGSRAA